MGPIGKESDEIVIVVDAVDEGALHAKGCLLRFARGYEFGEGLPVEEEAMNISFGFRERADDVAIVVAAESLRADDFRKCGFEGF